MFDFFSIFIKSSFKAQVYQTLNLVVLLFFVRGPLSKEMLESSFDPDIKYVLHVDSSCLVFPYMDTGLRLLTSSAPTIGP